MFYAQEKNDNVGFQQYSSSVFNTKEASLNVVSAMNTKSSGTSSINQYSGVQIQQIGDFNTVNATLRSNNAKISVGQNGDGNELYLDKTANTIIQSVIQQGDNNKISDFTFNTKYDVNMEIIQNGDNQNVQNIGTNSISKNMKITQTGNGASVIVINN